MKGDFNNQQMLSVYCEIKRRWEGEGIFPSDLVKQKNPYLVKMFSPVVLKFCLYKNSLHWKNY